MRSVHVIRKLVLDTLKNLVKLTWLVSVGSRTVKSTWDKGQTLFFKIDLFWENVKIENFASAHFLLFYYFIMRITCASASNFCLLSERSVFSLTPSSCNAESDKENTSRQKIQKIAGMTGLFPFIKDHAPGMLAAPCRKQLFRKIAGPASCCML